MPKISVIVPVYNSSKFLEECLDSVIKQTFIDYEVVIVDNCSTDTSMQIAEMYAQKYPNINIIKHETNRGLLQSCITGAKNAHSEYLMNIDSDDYLTTDTALEILSQKIDETNADVIQFGIESDTDEGWLAPLSFSKVEGDKIRQLYFDDVRCSTLWSRLIKKELYLKAMSVMPEDVDITMSEDVAQMPLIMELAESYVGIEKKLYHYRIHDGGTYQQKKSSEKIQLIISTIKTILDILSANMSTENYKIIESILCKQALRDISEGSFPIPKSTNIFEQLLQCFTPAPILAEIFSRDIDSQIKFFSKVSWTHLETDKPSNTKNIGLITRDMFLGGAERVNALLLDAFVEYGYDVTLFTTTHPNFSDFKYTDKVERVVVSDEPSRIFAECQRIISTYPSIDTFIINDRDTYESYSYMISLKYLGKKVIVMPHQDLFHNVVVHDYTLSHHRIVAIYNLIYQNMDAITSLIPYNVDYLQSIGVNSYLVSNLPTYEISDEVYEKDNTIVWCGRMDVGKNPLDVVKAFYLAIPHIDSDIKLVLVGDGDENDIVKKYIHENELKDRIVLTGHTDPKPYYQKASLHLMASNSEAFPMVIFETKILGVPTLMYELPNIVFSGTKGIISVPQSNIKALSDKIVELFNTPNVLAELGMQAKESALDFTVQRTMETWDKIIDDVCNNKTNEYKPSTQDLQYTIKKLNDIYTQIFMGNYQSDVKTDNRIQKIIKMYNKLKSIFNRLFPQNTKRRVFVIKILKFGIKVCKKLHSLISR